MTVVYLLPGTTSWSVPGDWNNAANSVETIGAGGGGQTADSGFAGSGGGGGAYSKVSNLTLAGSITVSIGSGGTPGVDGGDTYFNGASLGASSVGAKGGVHGTDNSGGQGGQAGSGVGTTTFSGGNGGAAPGATDGGGGGGGAAGPGGAGKNGGANTGGNAGAGGGGAAGGSSTAGVNNGGSNVGGAGGVAQDGTAGGTAGNPGSHGSGGGGGSVGANAGAGGNGIEFDSTHGAGGGGGGGGGASAGGNGGNGGSYGGGGGGGGWTGGAKGTGGSGGDGLIIITYTPIVIPLNWFTLSNTDFAPYQQAGLGAKRIAGLEQKLTPPDIFIPPPPAPLNWHTLSDTDFAPYQQAHLAAKGIAALALERPLSPNYPQIPRPTNWWGGNNTDTSPYRQGWITAKNIAALEQWLSPLSAFITPLQTSANPWYEVTPPPLKMLAAKRIIIDPDKQLIVVAPNVPIWYGGNDTDESLWRYSRTKRYGSLIQTPQDELYILPPLGPIAGITRIKSNGISSVPNFGVDPRLAAPGTPDPLWVALEVDLYDDSIGDINTLLLSNRGPLTRTINGVLREYEPRLRTPILIGTQLAAEFSNQPLRGQPNAGTIDFAFDADLKNEGWFESNIHWLGRQFRLYEGRTLDEVGVDVDGSNLSLIYTGQVDALTFDLTASDGQAVRITSTDNSSDLNKSIVDDLYPSTFPIVSLQGKPRPQLWGGIALSIEAVLEDQANLIYRASRNSCQINAVRVGGVPWRAATGATPLQGEYLDNGDGTFTLGATTSGANVRCDAQVGDPTTFDTAAAIQAICDFAGVTTDPAYMAQLRLDWPAPINYWTGTDPKLGLDALDEIVTANVCWWAFGPDGSVIAGAVKVPDPTPDYICYGSDPKYPLDISSWPVPTLDLIPHEIMVLDLGVNSGSTSGGGLIPPAWRVRVEYARNWSPETSFLGGVTQEEQAALNAPGLVADWPDPFNTGYTLSPLDGQNIRAADPRADDIYIASLCVDKQDAYNLRLRLVQGVTGPSVRRLYDLYGWIPNDQIKLFQTIYFYWRDDSRVQQAIFNGNFRVLSALYSVGGSASQLQLWGDTTFTTGPEPPIPVAVSISGNTDFTSQCLSNDIVAGDFFSGGADVLTSDGSAFTGTVMFTTPFGNAGGMLVLQPNPPFGTAIVFARDLLPSDNGTHNFSLAVTENGFTITQNFTFCVSNPTPLGNTSTPQEVIIRPSRIGIANSATSGTVIASVSVVMLDGSGFNGTLSLANNPFGIFALTGNSIILARNLSSADNSGLANVSVIASQNGGSAENSLFYTIS